MGIPTLAYATPLAVHGELGEPIASRLPSMLDETRMHMCGRLKEHSRGTSAVQQMRRFDCLSCWHTGHRIMRVKQGQHHH